MEKRRFNLALLFPLLAMVTIVAFAGGLGVVFILINETTMHEWGVIGLGMALMVGVPSAAALAERMVERK